MNIRRAAFAVIAIALGYATIVLGQEGDTERILAPVAGPPQRSSRNERDELDRVIDRQMGPQAGKAPVDQTLLAPPVTRPNQNASRRIRSETTVPTSQAPTAPAPQAEDSKTRIYTLRYANAQNAALAIRSVYPEGQLSIGIDATTNSLLIRASAPISESVLQILEALDRPGAGIEKGAPETLQLRLVWLVSDNSATIGRTPIDPFDLNSEVTKALEVLGFEGSRVVCKHMTSVTKYPGETSEFSFDVPVVINAQVVDFQGQGSISGDDTHHVRLQAGIGIDEPSPQRGLGRGGEPGRRRLWNMGGSIAMPLAHYVVMGTTNLVLFGGEPQAYPAALVVYLDRAPAIPAMEQRAAGGSAPARGLGGGRGRGGRGRRSGGGAEGGESGVQAGGTENVEGGIGPPLQPGR
jgi:hypothetical protein